MDRVDRAELGAFLRRARERVHPADVGLELTARRRTPGLRRSEVAGLAGISVEYYTRLEQGRGARPSRQVLTAIGRALRLSEDERAYAAGLTGAASTPLTGPARDVRPGLLHLLDQLDDAPAMVCDAKLDVLAWNPMARALLPDLLSLPEGDRNVAWRYFTDRSRSRLPDPEGTFAREIVANLRLAASRYRTDPAIRRLVTRLVEASEEFRTLWDAHDVHTSPTTTKRIHHAEIGWIELDCEALHDPERDQWVILYTARPGTPAYDALQLLKVIGGTWAARPGG